MVKLITQTRNKTPILITPPRFRNNFDNIHKVIQQLPSRLADVIP